MPCRSVVSFRHTLLSAYSAAVGPCAQFCDFNIDVCGFVIARSRIIILLQIIDTHIFIPEATVTALPGG